MKSKTVAIFGGSFFREGDHIYDTAEKTGTTLAKAGIRLKTGGYDGVMEAASKGAAEAGGEVEAVLVKGLGDFPNKYVGSYRMTRDLYERTKLLIADTDAFIVFPGKAGTLAELAFLLALKRIDALDPLIYLYGDLWKKQIDNLFKENILDAYVICGTKYFEDPDAMLGALLGDIGNQ